LGNPKIAGRLEHRDDDAEDGWDASDAPPIAPFVAPMVGALALFAFPNDKLWVKRKSGLQHLTDRFVGWPLGMES
jgi:hypothetical protein